MQQPYDAARPGKFVDKLVSFAMDSQSERRCVNMATPPLLQDVKLVALFSAIERHAEDATFFA